MIMTDLTYDPEADAVYIVLAPRSVDQTQEAGPLIYDLDAEGRIVGIEILAASKVLAPGDSQRALRPDAKTVDSAE